MKFWQDERDPPAYGGGIVRFSGFLCILPMVIQAVLETLKDFSIKIGCS